MSREVRNQASRDRSSSYSATPSIEAESTSVIAVALTTNLKLVSSPGNVLVPAKDSGLVRDSVANVSQVITVDKAYLTTRVGLLSEPRLAEIDRGLRLVLDL
jgi:mRNA interferase MazF